MALTDKELLERDAQRDIGAELLSAVREAKAGRWARKTVQWYLANPEWVAHVQSGAYRDWVQTQYAAQPAG
jgi:dTDP-D-glucose 4,6-dehydratase